MSEFQGKLRDLQIASEQLRLKAISAYKPKKLNPTVARDLAQARIKVALSLETRDKLNAFYGRMKGGIAR